MIREPIYQYDNETHEAICVLTYNNNTFTGTATCHPDDYDMESAKTGQTIAYLRAAIKYYQHIKNNELKPKLDALYQYYYSINRSKEFDKKSYEVKMLWRQIQNYEDDLAVVRCSLAQLRKNLSEFIQNKDEIYKKIRNNREGTQKLVKEIKEIQNKAKSDQ